MNLVFNKIYQGDCIEVLSKFPDNSIDLVFADPPYNLQLSQELWRPDASKVDAVDEKWDQFVSFEAYDNFTHAWLSACRRVLKDTGTLWVIGTYHNIFRIGSTMQDLGFWFLNDIIWIKTNPMPNFRGVRFTNAHETLIWASKAKGARYTFNHHAMKTMNHGKQMRSDWTLPLCKGIERLKVDREKAHPTQKPEALLYRVILASSKPGDLILDPFFGTGTTGAVAQALHRNWIGIEQETKYIQVAQKRIDAIQPELLNESIFNVRDQKRLAPRVSVGKLLEAGLLLVGQKLYFKGKETICARVKSDGKLIYDGLEASIHQVARQIMGGNPCNGWDLWYFQDKTGNFQPIDSLRESLRKSRTS